MLRRGGGVGDPLTGCLAWQNELVPKRWGNLAPSLKVACLDIAKIALF